MTNKGNREGGVRWRLDHVITVISIVITVLLGLYVVHLQTTRARLDFVISDKTPLFAWRNQSGPKFRLLFNDREIASASIVTILIENSGNADLVPIDQANPSHEQNPQIAFECAEGCELLRVDWDQTSGDPSNRFVPLETTARTATFLVKLMNKDATARFHVYLANCDSEQPVTCVARGKGVHSRKVPPKGQSIGNSWLSLAPLAFAILVVYALFWLVGSGIRVFRPQFLFLDPSKKAKDSHRNALVIAAGIFILIVIIDWVNRVCDYFWREFML